MGKSKSRTLVIVIIIVIVLVILFMLPRWSDKTRVGVKVWDETGVGCLRSHENANLHIHPLLKITVDGRAETVPANIGIVRTCMAETHTHDASGEIHIESVAAGKTFTLQQFFTVWGKTLDREGYDLSMTVDGVQNTELGNLTMRDHQEIFLSYATKAGS